jgi:ElaB/YqjD/DUF883 family membrane-anchored ribosome-binding protein
VATDDELRSRIDELLRRTQQRIHETHRIIALATSHNREIRDLFLKEPVPARNDRSEDND